jgi:CheY-like chemotaxis protein
MTRNRLDHVVSGPAETGDATRAAQTHLPTILIVDDDPDTRVYLIRCLREIRSEIGPVLEAGDGVAALAQARQTKIDLIISDVVMPRMDGITLIRELRSDAALVHISVLLVTGELTLRDLGEQVGSAGLVDILRKPFNTDKLCRHVRRLLSRAPPQDRGEE